VEVWFEDEARVGQRGTMTRIWARKGTRPRVVRQLKYEYAYLYGAVCPASGKTASLVLPNLNTMGMQKHIEEIAHQVGSSKCAVVILDRASWHTTKKLQLPPNIFLMPLPKAAPELNPVEQVWQVLRDQHLANRVFDSYDQIVDCCCYAWNWFADGVESIKQLCSREWASIM
jgi:hypothetical protein